MTEVFSQADLRTLGNLVKGKYSAYADIDKLDSFTTWLEEHVHELEIPAPETISLKPADRKALKKIQGQAEKLMNTLDQLSPDLKAVLNSGVGYRRELEGIADEADGPSEEEIEEFMYQDLNPVDRRRRDLNAYRSSDLSKHTLQNLRGIVEAEINQGTRGVNADQGVILFTRKAIRVFEYIFGRKPAKSEQGLFQDVFDVFLQRLNMPRRDLKYLVTRADTGQFEY